MVRALKQVSTDAGLIKYLMRHWHSTPFEMCELNIILNYQYSSHVNGLDTEQQMLMNIPQDIQFWIKNFIYQLQKI